MQKKPNFTVLREQMTDVVKVLSQQGLIDPEKPSTGKYLIKEALYSSLTLPGDIFVKYLPYKNVEFRVKLGMSDVSTDGENVHVTPVVVDIMASNYPFRTEGVDCPQIERLCKEAVQKVLVPSNV